MSFMIVYDTTEYRSKKSVELLRAHGYEIFGSSISYEEISFIKHDLLK